MYHSCQSKKSGITVMSAEVSSSVSTGDVTGGARVVVGVAAADVRAIAARVAGGGVVLATRTEPPGGVMRWVAACSVADGCCGSSTVRCGPAGEGCFRSR